MKLLWTAAIAAVGSAALVLGADLKTSDQGLVVHEWGTFSSVAKEDGSAVAWAPLAGPADLPCFVARSGLIQKVGTSSLVRMETPVLYFYSDHPVNASVGVKFNQGYISEWYPDRAGTRQTEDPQSIQWDNVHVMPGPDLEYPGTQGLSHYYAARATDAAPLRIGNEQEKMIFYRGFGTFTPPLTAAYDAGKLKITNTGTEPIPFVIAFENHDGQVGYRVAEHVTGSVSLDELTLTQDADALHEMLASRLTALGLYPKEARAMVATWADSWFNEGARVFYIMPRLTVDSLLPLTITPLPSRIERVFVGRVEVLSPRTQQTLTRALRSGDSTTLAQFSRFLTPFMAQMQRSDPKLSLSPAMKAFVKAAANGSSGGDNYGSAPSPSASCVQ